MSATATRPWFRYAPGWQDNIPAELKARRQIVVWRFVLRDGKWTKAPFCPVPRPDGKYHEAKTNDPSTWGSWHEGLAALADRGGRFDGIGFVFSADDPYCGIDLDKCYNPKGSVQEWARPYLDKLGSYAEVSPSGAGIKIIVRGSIPVGRGNKKTRMGPDETGAVEIYDRVRFFTLTGRIPDGADPGEIADRAGVLAEIHAALFPPVPPTEKKPGSTPEPLDLTDREVLGKAFESRNGHIISGLFAGDIAGYGSHSEADLGLCSRLTFWFQGDPNRMDRVFRQSGLYRDKWDQLRGEKTYGEMTLAKALESWDGECYSPKGKGRRRPSANGAGAHGGGGNGQAGANGDGGAAAGPDRVDVEINPRWHEVLDQTLPLLRRDPDLYRRGAILVTVHVETEDEIQLTASTVLKGMAGTPRVIALSPSNLGCRLTRIAAFYQWAKDKKGEYVSVPASPPKWLIEAVATHGHYPGVRPLLAVVECPYPLPDGSIATTPGYDPATGTLFRPSMKFLPVPDRPTQEQAQEAAGRILALVAQFPFKSKADRAVWLAGLLTVIARPVIDGPVPGVAFNGNRAGIGKGLLTDIIALIALGRIAPTSIYPEGQEEAAKVRVSIALAAPPIVSFDNLEEGSSYGNGAFDSAITSNVVNDRILGSSRHTGDIVLRSTMFLNGNNVAPGKDAHRRWLPSNLVSDLERPEERADITIPDLRKHVSDRRGDFVRDALTILRAHARAGYPTADKAALGSFEAWDRIIRGAVYFAYGEDPCQTRRVAADEAPARLARLALLEGWSELPGGKKSGVTTTKAIAEVTEHAGKYETLRNALLQYGRDGKLATARALGNILRGMKGTKIEGMRFDEKGKEHGAVLWKVEGERTPRSTSQEEAEGESGESGESAFPPTRASPDDHSDIITS